MVKGGNKWHLAWPDRTRLIGRPSEAAGEGLLSQDLSKLREKKDFQVLRRGPVSPLYWMRSNSVSCRQR